MSRGIKFRGYSEDYQKWYYGYFVKNAEGECFIRSIDDFETYHVVEKTVGQFTGLYDKNGKEIYEGDIVRVKSASANPIQITHKGKNLTAYEPIYENWFVVFYKGCFGLHNEPTTGSHESKSKYNGITYAGDLRGKYDIEIIGNIYDNPELLEKR